MSEAEEGSGTTVEVTEEMEKDPPLTLPKPATGAAPENPASAGSKDWVKVKKFT
jgi:hypothetical protein